MMPLLPVTLPIVLGFAIISDDNPGRCDGLSARWAFVPGTPVEYLINETNQAVSGASASIDGAFNDWNNVGSSAFVWSNAGTTTDAGFVLNNGRNSISWGDPDNVMNPGTLAAAVPFRPGPTHVFDSTTYRSITEMDIVFNDGTSFLKEVDIGSCTSEFIIESILMHEAGHGLGLDHPDQCDGAYAGGYPGAIMYSSINPCDAGKLALTVDDIGGVTFLYDNGKPLVYPSYSASATAGYTPFTVDFTDASIGATSWAWAFGDGGSSTDQSPSYTYQVAGNFTVNLQLNGALDADATDIQVVARPDLDFSTDVVSGAAPLTVAFTTTADPGLTSFGWDFGDGGTADTKDTAYVFLTPGTYSVTLTANDGPVGPLSEVKTALIEVTARETKSLLAQFFGDFGCAVVPGGNSKAPAPITLLGLVAWVLWRRRSSRS